MQIHKVEAAGDTMFIKAETQQAAEDILFETTGPIPRDMLVWSTVDELPEGEELLNPED